MTKQTGPESVSTEGAATEEGPGGGIARGGAMSHVLPGDTTDTELDGTNLDANGPDQTVQAPGRSGTRPARS
jgi:hypothetical protein